MNGKYGSLVSHVFVRYLKQCLEEYYNLNLGGNLRKFSRNSFNVRRCILKSSCFKEDIPSY